MRHDDESALARGRFFASIDRLVNEVSVADDSCGGDGVLPVPEAGSLLKGEYRAHTPAVDEEGEGATSAVDLMGDWSWRPENQPQDPGYIFGADEVSLVNSALCATRAFELPERDAMRFAMRLLPPRPWMVPAHVGSPGPVPRINTIR